MATARKKAVVKKEEAEVVNVPAHIKQGGNRGSENVTNEDLQLPRIGIVQDLSPQKDKGEVEYIEGAEIGDMFNTLTGELYDEVTITPITFQKRWFVWKGQDFGGGLQGIYDFDKQAEAEATAAKLNEGLDEPEYECVLTHEHLGLLPNGDEIILSMAKSKLKVSKKWNSLVRINGGDRFSRNYKITVVRETSKVNNKKFYNFQVADQLGARTYPNSDQYSKAESLYLSIADGLNYGGDYSDSMDAEYEETSSTEDDDDKPY